MQTAAQLRQAFITYFKNHTHDLVPSAGLIPQSDPSLLFVNAGMVPFKKFFLGEQKPKTPRVISVQKCIRAGGKHNDLDNVGYTARHHTFFEMLGNFSFGNYFKKDAIFYGWDFLVNTVGLDPKKLWITVHYTDQDARQIWHKDIGVAQNRILDGQDKDNFWSMGPTGPCGPCSEIHVDQGIGSDPKCPNPKTCDPFCDCDRFLEVWNLVFMQFDRSEDGTLTPLPNPSIDTGMGLERLTAVVQGVRSNYDTDLFQSLIKKAETIFKTPYGQDPKADVALRVVADHARATTFLIADGVLPSNEGRGYVLRRIMRRAIRYGRQFSNRELFFADICDTVIKQMGDVYPELPAQATIILKAVKQEEERFGETLERGLQIFEQAKQETLAQNRQILAGELVFRLYDTFGFPADLTEILAREAGLGIDMAGFETAMAKQQAMARADRKAHQPTNTQHFDLPTTVFTGYHELTATSPVILILKNETPVDTATVGDKISCVFSATPFYAESGGQIADFGTATWADGQATVVDVQKQDGLYFHTLDIVRGTLKVDMLVDLSVDLAWRQKIRSHHTATHLLQAALRQTLGTHIRQAGSLVEPKRLRFDFSHVQTITPQEQQQIEDIINQQIRTNLPVTTIETTYDDAIARGALAFFGEKYGANVRMVDIGGVSIELCGGTHVSHTGELGLFMIDYETSVAAGIRRIEAITAEQALVKVNQWRTDYRSFAEKLGTTTKQLSQRIDQLLATVEQQTQQLQTLQVKQAQTQVQQLLNQTKKINQYDVLATLLDVQTMDEIKQLADVFIKQQPETILLFVAQTAEKPLYFISIPQIYSKQLHAGKLLNQLIEPFGGRGGGKEQVAQGGGGQWHDPQPLFERFFTLFA